jgi:hypothetical protein
MISKIFQGGGVITKDTPLYMLNTPEKLEKYNSIVKKDYEMRKRLPLIYRISWFTSTGK